MILCLLVEAIVSTYTTEQEAQVQALGFEINDLVRWVEELRRPKVLLLSIYGRCLRHRSHRNALYSLRQFTSRYAVMIGRGRWFRREVYGSVLSFRY